MKERLHVTVIDAKELFGHTRCSREGSSPDSSPKTRELKKRSHATFADTKDFFGHTPGVSYVNVKPALDAVLEGRQLSGLLLMHERKERLHVLAADTEEFFEYSFVVLPANVEPAQLDQSHVTVADAKDFFEYTDAVLHASMAFSMADPLGPAGPPTHDIAVFFQRSRQPLEASISTSLIREPSSETCNRWTSSRNR